VDILPRVAIFGIFGPALSAAIGYLADGMAGAASGFSISLGPLIIVWLFGAR
jgi:hypothetical protein